MKEFRNEILNQKTEAIKSGKNGFRVLRKITDQQALMEVLKERAEKRAKRIKEYEQRQ